MQAITEGVLLVVLQQTSPLPVCPGDNVTFTCTVTESYPILTWINPNNVSIYDRQVYTGDSVLYKDGSVEAFTTRLIANPAGSLVSTATLSEVTVQDDGSQGVTCIYNIFQVHAQITDHDNHGLPGTTSPLSFG